MRSLAVPIVLGLITVSCSTFESDDRVVVGSGVEATVTRSVADFTEVEFASEGTVTIVQGGSEGLEIIGDDNLIERIDTSVEGGVLVITTEPGIDVDPIVELRFVIGVDDLARLSVAGAGDVEAERLEAIDLVIELSGAGDISVGQIDADVVDIAMTGAGDLRLAGLTRRLIVDWRGAGRLEAAALRSASATVVLSGVGELVVDTDSLTVSGGGSGSVRYAGEPVVDDTTTGVVVVEPLPG